MNKLSKEEAKCLFEDFDDSIHDINKLELPLPPPVIADLKKMFDDDDERMVIEMKVFAPDSKAEVVESYVYREDYDKGVVYAMVLKEETVPEGVTIH